MLQNGRPRIDLAIYKGQRAYGWGYTKLLDRGYSYDIISNPHLFLPEAVVRNGELCPQGPGYRALLVVDQEMLPVPSAEKLLALAKAGLPVVFVGKIPQKANGAFSEDGKIADLMAQLRALENVAFVDTLENAAECLSAQGIEPRAKYRRDKLESICRQDETGIYYFFYNGGEAVETEVLLSGDGKPVVLNAWTGDMTPIPYVQTKAGTQIRLKLSEGDAAIVALLPDAELVTEKEMLEPVTLDAFDTTIISWGPDPEAAVPTQSKKTVLELGIQKAGAWDALPATEEQLALLGVDALAHVSGQGIYRAEFTLPECDGAVLTVDTGDCMVVAGTINGEHLPAVNQRSGMVDLSGLVHAGENTLELEIATTLINRLRISHPLFDGKGGMPAPPAPSASEDGEAPMMGNLEDEDYELPTAPMDMPSPMPGAYHYGVYGAVVTPYRNL